MLTGAYFIALAITIGLEAPVIAFFFPGQRRRMVITCVVATCVTHSFMHFVLPRLVHTYDQWILIGEMAALLLEALAYWFFSRPRDLGRALIASAIANTLSYTAGLVIFSG